MTTTTSVDWTADFRGAVHTGRVRFLRRARRGRGRVGVRLVTGPEHYREAERLLLSCQITRADENNVAIYPAVEDGLHTTTNALTAAQVHATLALAAATASTQATAYDGDEDHSRTRGWAGVA
jgi:hypothetical protein